MSDQFEERSAFSIYINSQPVSKKSEALKLKNKLRRQQSKQRKRVEVLRSEVKLNVHSNGNIKEGNNKPDLKDLTAKRKSPLKKKAKLQMLQPQPLNTRKKSTKTIDRNSNSTSKVPQLIKVENEKKKKLATFLDTSDSDSDLCPQFSHQTDSIDDGKKLFAWLIKPTNVDTFLQDTWEKKPLFISRKNPMCFSEIISTPIIDKMLRSENIYFTKNIDITSYSNGVRETHNPVGRALPHVVWDYYLNGCSVRILNPQTYIPRINLLNVTLQEYFHCFVGANAYLTPPNTQGFAPHYDDIEAFILQIEGKKHWKVYAPRSSEEVLPRVSSQNFEQSEIGEPVLDVVLKPGDLLYFPRGYIHQGRAVDDQHSLHITLSLYQKNAWADLLEKLLPQALESAISESVEFRKGLPIDTFQHLGCVHSDSNAPRRIEIIASIKKLFHKIADYLPIDDAVDQVAKNFVHCALPPVLGYHERQLTVYGDNDLMTKNGLVINRVEVQLDTKVRLLRANVIRMVMEENTIRIYYNVENSKEYQGLAPQFLEISSNLAPAVETLIQTYPEYVSVEQLDVPDDIDKIQVAGDLWEKGIIMTEEQLDLLE